MLQEIDDFFQGVEPESYTNILFCCHCYRYLLFPLGIINHTV